jgi:hypothetical protein
MLPQRSRLRELAPQPTQQAHLGSFHAPNCKRAGRPGRRAGLSVAG